MRKQRLAIVAGLLLLALAAGRDLGKLHGAAPWRNMYDLPEFYCAGRAVVYRQNPYTTEALRACEHRLNHGEPWKDPTYVIPAPQPPFDFPPYSLLSFANYSTAKIVVAILTALSVVGTALAVADLGIPFLAALAALALSDAFVGVLDGQIYPFAIMLFALAAAALRRGRFALSGSLAALTMIEPQIGIPICLTLLVWVSRTRVALVSTGCILIAAGILTVGLQPFVQWATVVIPAQAHSEIAFWAQYSLTSVLATLGVPDRIALFAGSVSYVAMLGLALWLAKRLANRFGRAEFLILVPAALAVIGGTYVHIAAIPAAIPFALALAFASSPSARLYLAPLLILLAIPWLFAQDVKPLFFSSLLVAVVTLIELRVPLRYGVAVALLVASGLYLIAVRTPPPLTLLPPVPAHGAAAMLAASDVSAAAFDLSREIAKVPTWIGLLGLLGAAVVPLTFLPRPRW